MARQKEVEHRAVKHLERKQQIRIDALLSIYAVGIGLAHHNLYGPGRDDKIEPFIREWNDIVCKIHRDDVSFFDLQKELEEKTGIYFNFGD